MNTTILSTALMLSVLFSACQVADKGPAANSNSSQTPRSASKHAKLDIKTQTGRPDIEIGSYTLIADDPEAVRTEAEAVMEVKKKYPLAMRTKDRSLFEQILARDFTFYSKKDFFNRKDYIDNRTAGELTDWSVKYEDVTLQFIDENALVSYRNIVKGNDKTGKPEYIETMSWADIYSKENGTWKIKAVHLIDYKEEILSGK